MKKGYILTVLLVILSCFTFAESISGFEVKSKKYCDEVKSDLVHLKHIKTGAEVFAVLNKEQTMSFSIAFRTLPEDNTGVMHIIEHSCFSGSRKFPNNSLWNMMKKSVAFGMNAQTHCNFTDYYFSTVNEKDFMNLMDQYMDGVFYPEFLTNEAIFKQEGWRYEIASKDSELKINGIVYNESKTNSSSWERYGKKYEGLFPGTPYVFDGGGNINNIPNLTWKKMKETYKKFYIPSNAKIILYGNINLDKVLNFLDDNYFSSMEYIQNSFDIPEFKPLNKDITLKIRYNSSSKDDRVDLETSFAGPKISDKEEILAFELINSKLRENGSSLFTDYETENLVVSTYTSIFKETDVASDTADSLRDLATWNYDPQFLNECKESFYKIRNNYFYGRNKSKSIIYYVYNSWMHDGSPDAFIDTKDTVDKICKQENYFQSVMNKYLSDKNYLVHVLSVSDKNINIIKDEKERLAEIYKNMTVEKKEDAIKNAQFFSKRNNSKNSYGTLTLKDIDFKFESPEIKTEKFGAYILRYTKSDIIDKNFINIYFDGSNISEDKIRDFNFYGNMIGSFISNTQNDGLKVFNVQNKIKPYYVISLTVSDKYFDGTLSTINSILFNMDTLPLAQVRNKIQNDYNYFMEQITTKNYTYSEKRAMSYVSATGKILDEADGIGYLLYVKDLLDRYFEDGNDIKQRMLFMDKYYKNCNMIISYSGSKEGYEKIKNLIKTFPKRSEMKPVKNISYSFNKTKAEGFYSNITAQSVYKAGYIEHADKYFAEICFLREMINNGYIKVVRENGGAYGVSFDIYDTGEFVASSSFDPNLKSTLNAYNGIVSFLKNYNYSSEKFEENQISALGTFMIPYETAELVRLYDELFIENTSIKTYENKINSIKKLKPEDIKKLIVYFEKMSKQDTYLVIGEESIMLKNKNLFKKLIKLN